jgi:hypothetical protein
MSWITRITNRAKNDLHKGDQRQPEGRSDRLPHPPKISPDNPIMLVKRVEQLNAVAAEGNDELLQLADKYLSGWRPKDFGRG